MIDTETRSIAKKKPSVSSFSSQEDYLKALRMHEEALKFFREKFPELEVYISTHQIGEIYHVLAFRGTKVPKEEAKKIVWALLEDDKIIKVPLLPGHLKDALEESAKTGIHVWDYLCFLPVKDYIDVVYSCDIHFQKIGEEFDVKVINPLGGWLFL